MRAWTVGARKICKLWKLSEIIDIWISRRSTSSDLWRSRHSPKWLYPRGSSKLAQVSCATLLRFCSVWHYRHLEVLWRNLQILPVYATQGAWRIVVTFPCSISQSDSIHNIGVYVNLRRDRSYKNAEFDFVWTTWGCKLLAPNVPRPSHDMQPKLSCYSTMTLPPLRFGRLKLHSR